MPSPSPPRPGKGPANKTNLLVPAEGRAYAPRIGIDIQQAKFLYHARDHGVCFAKVGVLGRQLMMASREQLAQWLDSEPNDCTAPQREGIAALTGRFAEPFLELLGAKEIVSFDASDYEQATEVHDFNQSIAECFHGRFDTVVDSGSLEHIFNFPVAITNLMQMVKPGGHLLIMTPANNFCGHGFYQFSPELFYRLLNGTNGFAVRRMLVAESFPDAYWWEVPDPALLRRRVTFENRYWTHLYLIAQRVADEPILMKSPQQSDYATAWDQASAAGNAGPIPPAASRQTPPEGYWQKRCRRFAGSLQYQWLKYLKFHGKDRELMMKGDIFRRVEGP
jgi:SAM-dependent methyltransferase